jgi:hypothetical protein
LPQSAGIGADQPRYAYRVIVVGRDDSGNEIFSTAVWVRSDQSLTGSEVRTFALAAMVQIPQQYRVERRGLAIATFDTFIMLAGQRAS